MGQVLENIKKYKLIEQGDNIVLGLSGGPDSVYLFYKLLEARKHIDFNIFIAHINHDVRGKYAERDQDFVKNLADKYKIPFYYTKENMDDLAKKLKISSEEAGRKIRYSFFNKILNELGGGKVAVGHNKSDQVETVLMRFLRGTGLDGLKGMDFSSGNIIRPILNIDREEIEAFLDKNGLDYKIDHTNLQNIYMRNRTRLELIPYIEEHYNSNFIDVAFNNSFIFKEDGDFINKCAQATYHKLLKQEEADKILLKRQDFSKEHISIQSRILRQGILKIKGNLHGVTKEHIDLALALIIEEGTGKYIDLIDNIIIAISYDDIVVTRKDKLLKASNQEDKPKLKCEILDIDKIDNLYKDSYTKYFDYDKVRGKLTLRTRKPGDSFQPLGMKGRKKIKDFFIDEKVPREKRDRIQLLCDEEDIIWVVGYRISEFYKIDKETKKVLKVEIEGGHYGK